MSGYLFDILEPFKIPKVVRVYQGSKKGGGVEKQDFQKKEVVVDAVNKDSKCTIKFEEGKRYLIKAERIPIPPYGETRAGDIAERWWTSPCYGTKQGGSLID